MIRRKYWERNQPCPVVMIFGCHPLFLVMAGLEVPSGVDEFNWVGAAAGKRVPVIRGPVTGLPIPADAEVAVEGFVSQGEVQEEGPFGEFTGYYAGGKSPEPLLRVQALYYRNHPILLNSSTCRPVHDYSYYASVLRSAAIKESLRKAGVPGVKGVWVSEAGGNRMWVVTSIEQKYAGHAAQAANLAVQGGVGGLMNRYSIVVDEDIDPSNNDDVIWALSTRSDPATDVDIVRQCWSNPLDPMISTEQKNQKQLWNSRAIINACRPWDRLRAGDFPPVAEATPALLKATREKWAWLLK
jgi:UbiD family decarboxylase